MSTSLLWMMMTMATTTSMMSTSQINLFFCFWSKKNTYRGRWPPWPAGLPCLGLLFISFRSCSLCVIDGWRKKKHWDRNMFVNKCKWHILIVCFHVIKRIIHPYRYAMLFLLVRKEKFHSYSRPLSLCCFYASFDQIIDNSTFVINVDSSISNWDFHIDWWKKDHYIY